MNPSTEDANFAAVLCAFDALKNDIPPQDRPAVKSLLRALLRDESVDDVKDRLNKGLGLHVQRLWTRIQERSRGAISLHIDPFERSFEDGAVFRRTVIQIIQDDIPFLVDSLLACLMQQGFRVKTLWHPVLCVTRDAHGAVLSLSEQLNPEAPQPLDSCIHIELKGTLTETEQSDLEKRLRDVLDDVLCVVHDWPQMREKSAKALAHLSSATPSEGNARDVVDLLHWLEDHHATFLGYREQTPAQTGPSETLGLFRSKHPPAVGPITMTLSPTPDDWPPQVSLRRSRALSTVHRADRVFVLDIRETDASGNVIKVRQYLGLPPNPANSRSSRDVPYIRQKIQRMVEHSGFVPQGYSSKALVQVFEQIPQEELLLAPESLLLATALDVLRHHEQRHVVVYHRFDPHTSSLHVLLFTLRARFRQELGAQMTALLQEYFKATVFEAHTYLNEFSHALMHVTLDVDQEPNFDLHDLTTRIVEASLTWDDRFHDHLLEVLGEEQGSRYVTLYGHAFPESYQAVYDGDEALRDAHQIDALREQSNRDAEWPTIGTALRQTIEGGVPTCYLKLFQRDVRLPLSDILPILENLGFAASAETAYTIRVGKDEAYCIQDFRATNVLTLIETPDALAQRFHEVFTNVRSGQIENDGFNRLILRSRLNARQITLLRAYAKYLKQTGSSFSQPYIEDVLSRNTSIAELLIAYFESRFDPETATHERSETYLSALLQSLESIQNPDDDRILRRFVNLMSSTLRCNAYQRDNDVPKDYIAFKFNGKSIVDLPEPRPMCEIFIYSPRFEAVHLRASKVARGGIRWSDRREDFRTEILGLLKAQIVKNAVIVPSGAKGGFVLKRTFTSRDALMSEVIACYTMMMRALLELTDNWVDGRIQRPHDTVCYDGDDPYLVVAADKGTATFSDRANQVSKDFGFWLGDAFASGGSAGYDHKKLGITARGAWESVRHHGRELGLNPDEQPLRVVAVGDMSGDVFGNGMLMSRHIHLVGAFNHEHIFIDPTPDAQASFDERQRLFALPRSSWADYTSTTLSSGGGVFSRAEKWISLSAEVRSLLALDLEEDRLSPNALIQALLKAPVDLIWFGGIGTFIKAQHESHHDVGDRANDVLRVNAHQLRCKMIAEGANLGVTQAGRIEFAQRGGRINTDAIDNSAGVDCSDHEVNIKILFNTLLQAGQLDLPARNQRLEAMQDAVAELVLQDNKLQNKLISTEETQGNRILEFHARLIRHLEQKHALDRTQALLPDDTEIARRLAAQKDLTRPELAVLLAHTKISLCEDLLQTSFPNDPLLDRVVLRYFPAPLQKDFARDIAKHPLRRDIITTCLVNTWINRLGLTFIFRVAEATGANLETIARALHASITILNIEQCWEAIDRLDGKRSPAEQRELLGVVTLAVRRAVHWLLRQRTLLKSADDLLHYQSSFEGLYGHLHESLVPADQERYNLFLHHLLDLGLTASDAQLFATLRFMESVLDVVPMARDHADTITDVASVYFKIGDELGFDWARKTLESVSVVGHWQRTSRSLLHEDLTLYQSLITRAILAQKESTVTAKHQAWRQGQKMLLESLTHLLHHMKMSQDLNISSVDVFARRLRQLAEA